MSDDGSSGSNAAKSSTGSDAANPFFLHSSDHPDLILVSKKLNGNNYNTWSRAMRIAVRAIAMGTICWASKNQDWRCNDMVLSWILGSLEPDLADSVIYLPTAHEIWVDLHERFSQGNAPYLFQIQREINSLTQGQLSMAAYFTKLKGLWDELAAHSDNPLPTARQAYSSVSQEEKQRELGAIKLPDTAAMAVRADARSCQDRPPLYCSHYDVDHHTKETCWQLHGYPPGHPRYGKQPQFNPRNNNRSHNGKGGPIIVLVVAMHLLMKLLRTP
ncbi:uncharacterized protein LOC119995625 [Tripterygium wilfordii]|uniref:uncharacterized protein LOC119995625 n=1 Tax=Tripterygium wilfordii TaxID=458696 RepID=UPI0018F83F27|nr:uncharacterized protein LOC119995625 [Tripterygium wilfordii]